MNGSAFLEFVTKYCASSKMIDKLWEQILDYRDLGFIETHQEIASGLAFMAMNYKQRMYQKQNKTREKPKYQRKDLLAETEHIAVWIVRKYGKQRKRYNENQPYYLVIDKDKWQSNLPKWIKAYVQARGLLD